MENLEKICTVTHYNFPKNTILIPLAESLNINYKLFKNRKELINEIRTKCPPSKICENTKDFVSLDDIDDIPKDRLFLWTQNKKTYGADILSLKSYIDSGNTMNPWTIDFATGFNKAIDKDNYLKLFDMKNQRGLLKRISEFYNSINISENNLDDIESLNPNHTNRFNIEKEADHCDQYVTHIINTIEHCEFKIFIQVLSETLKNCVNYFLINNDINTVSILEPIYLQYEILRFHVYVSDLELIPNNLSIICDILDIIKNHKQYIYYIGVIKFFFIDLEESLKIYNLLER